MTKNIALTLIISIVVSVSIFLIGWKLIEWNNQKETVTVDFQEDYTIVAGVIRNTGKGWGLIQDAGHETLGITSVTSDNEKIIVSYANYNKVNSIAVTVDETMALERITVGASVGLNQSLIYLYDSEGMPLNPQDYVNEKGNIWIQGIFKK